VDKPKDNKLDSEIAKRLDDLFGEGDTSSGDENPIEAKDTAAEENEPQENELQENQPSAADEEIFDLAELATDETDGASIPDDYPLAELKHLVLSIDWEITEEALAGLLTQIDSLKATTV
jgi:hypothetical protein